MKNLSLLEAARVFDLIIPTHEPDRTVVGRIGNTAIHAGEVRRLNQAIAEVEEYDSADDGPEIDIIRKIQGLS